MTNIVYDYDGWRITAEGHAESDIYGEDLICAAVSILIHTLIESVQQIDGAVSAEGSSGWANVHAVPKPYTEAQMRTTFETVANGFRWLEEQYPEYVSLEVI